MSIEMVLMLLGGLALFLYGMQMMSTNLEAVAGNRMKDILEKLTSNRFLGVLVGAVITAVIQSSSATTVMVVGFVNSGLMSLYQAVGVIMGANIGTTITGQLIALDIGVIAPLIAFVGVVLIMFVKSKSVKSVGGIIAGLGVLFIGMGMMSQAMIPLRDSQTFVNLITQFSNPLLGILVGAAFTAIIQSSSASVGILQALAMSGLIGLDGAVYVLFGQNIGTCITAVLASIGTNRNAKRTTIIHLMFNVIGTVIFIFICMLTPFVDWMVNLIPNNPAAQIANVHTVFNITTTILLFPFGNQLANLAIKILPDKKEVNDEDHWLDEIIASQHTLGASTLAINSLKKDVVQMLGLAAENVRKSFQAVENVDVSQLSDIEAREEEIDLLNVKISRKVSRALSLEQPASDVNTVNHIYNIIGNIERVGDHAMNLAEYSVMMHDKDMKLSSEALQELGSMKDMCLKAMEQVINPENGNRQQALGEISIFEQRTDEMNENYRNNQVSRIKSGHCNIETSIIYSEILTDCERIGDHIMNIAESYVEVEQ